MLDLSAGGVRETPYKKQCRSSP